MNWVDAVILAVILVAVIKGYVDGFVVSLLNIGGIIVGIIAAKMYFKDLAQFLVANTKLYDRFYGFIHKGFENNGIIGKFFNKAVETGNQIGITNRAVQASCIYLFFHS